MISNRLATSVTAVALLSVTSASAQQTQQAQQQPQIAEQCMADIRDFAQQSAETGYGVGGPAGYGAPAPVGGWYGTYGPRREMSAVLAAAEVFARNGREEACQNVLAELRDLQEQRLAQLEEAGIPPEEVQSWRQELLVSAQPVSEVGGNIRIENVLGADVRNLRDQDLGDVEDVVLDVEGDLAYVLVGRGGFFGVGQDLVPVRWQDLRAVPDADTFVLDIEEDVFEQAPAVDRDVFADSDSYAQRRVEIDSYWDEHLQG
jgi:sporulation protein YlmC with PRC-barrel domain